METLKRLKYIQFPQMGIASLRQRYKFNVESDEFIQNVGKLRMEVVEHIKKHLERYQRTIFGRIYNKVGLENKKPNIPNITGDSTNFHDNYLSKDTAWAGPDTIQAKYMRQMW